VHDDSTVLYGLRIDNVYAINMSSIHTINYHALKHHLMILGCGIIKLGHSSIHTIEKLSKLDLVHGLPSYKFEKNRICDACVKEKQVCSSFKPKNALVYLVH